MQPSSSGVSVAGVEYRARLTDYVLLRCKTGKHRTPRAGDRASPSLLTNTSLLPRPVPQGDLTFHLVPAEIHLFFQTLPVGLPGNVLGTWLCLAVRTIWRRTGGWECRKLTLSHG